jgi:hypothetical protein
MKAQECFPNQFQHHTSKALSVPGMSKLAFLVGLLIQCQSRCHATPGDLIDLELRLSFSPANHASSLNQCDDNLPQVPLSCVPNSVATLPLLHSASQAVTALPSAGTYVSAVGWMESNVGSTIFRSSVMVPKCQEARTGIDLNEIPRRTGATSTQNVSPSSTDRSGPIQESTALEAPLDFTTKKRQDRTYDHAVSGKRPTWTGSTMDTTNQLGEDASFKSYRPMASAEKLGKFLSQNTHTSPGKEIISQSPCEAIITREPPKELVFDIHVFAIEETKTFVDESKINYLIKTIQDYGENGLLLVDESKLTMANKLFKEFNSYKPLENNSSGYKIKTDSLRRRASQLRWDFKNKSVQKMLEKRELWLEYWIKKSSIEEEYKNLKTFGKFSLEEVQDHFLLTLLYMGMITSIVVDKSDPHWKENQTNNFTIIIKNAASRFQDILQEVATHDIQDKCYSLYCMGNIQQTHNSWDSIKKNKLRLTWLLLRKWIQYEDRPKFLYEFLTPLKLPHIDLFDDVFCYSIVNLNKRISQSCR